jgi:hypothetical protein
MESCSNLQFADLMLPQLRIDHLAAAGDPTGQATEMHGLVDVRRVRPRKHPWFWHQWLFSS